MSPRYAASATRASSGRTGSIVASARKSPSTGTAWATRLSASSSRAPSASAASSSSFSNGGGIRNVTFGTTSGPISPANAVPTRPATYPPLPDRSGP